MLRVLVHFYITKSLLLKAATTHIKIKTQPATCHINIKSMCNGIETTGNLNFVYLLTYVRSRCCKTIDDREISTTMIGIENIYTVLFD